MCLDFFGFAWFHSGGPISCRFRQGSRGYTRAPWGHSGSRGATLASLGVVGFIRFRVVVGLIRLFVGSTGHA